MNLLFITPPPSLPSRLERIRSFNLIKYLSRRHKIHLLSLTTQKNLSEEMAEIKKYCESVTIISKPLWKAMLDCLLFLFSFLPLEIVYCRSKEMREKIKEILSKQKIDLIYVKRLRSAQFVENLNTSIPILLDTTDAMSLFYDRASRAVPWYKKPFYFGEYLKYRWYEKRMLRRFKNWVVCSREDIDYLKGIASGGNNFFYVPNVVDTEYFKHRGLEPEKNTILFSGLMNKFVNIETANYLINEIFPKILTLVPDAKLFIVGPNPPRSIRKLAAKNIEVTGFVPDLRECLARCEVVACPIKTGAGSRNKILQAWAMKKPIVSTPLGAEGLEYQPDKNILIADAPEEFASQVIRILKDETLKNFIAENGYKTAETKYSMEVVATCLNELLNSL